MTNKSFKLIAEFQPEGDQPKAITALVDGLQSGLAHQTLLGVTGSGKTFTIANVIMAVQRPTLILAPNKTLAAQLYGEMKNFFPHQAVEYFVSYYDYYQPEAYMPASDTYIAKDAAINEQIEKMRLSATKALLERHDAILVATVSAIYGLGDPVTYLKMAIRLCNEDQLDQRNLLRRLATLQYTRNEIDLQRATYRVRGEIIDIYPAELQDEAIRIEFLDQKIVNIYYIDPLTCKVLRKTSQVTIYPKTHYVAPKEIMMNAIEHIKQELKEHLEELYKANKLLEAQRLSQRTTYDLELIQELGYCQGIENYSRYLSGHAAGDPPPTLLDYLPQDALLVIDESHVTIPQLHGMYHGNRSRKETLIQYGFRLPSALDNRPLRFSEFSERAPQTIYISATPATYELTISQAIVEQLVRPTGLLDPIVIVRPASTQLDDLLSEIHKRVACQERVLATTLTKRLSEQLSDYLTEHGVRVRYLHSDVKTVERVEVIRQLRIGTVDVIIGINLLREGLDLPEVSLVAILDADKEGFLRSETALIQTIGRVARHCHGTAILYADRITNSMQHAISETERRRTKQEEYNREHHIIPRSIEKAVQDMLNSGNADRLTQHKYPVIPHAIDQSIKSLSPKALATQITQLEKKMYQHVHHLEFEEAALLRDKIQQLREQLLHC